MMVNRRQALLGLTAAWTMTGMFGRASMALAQAPTDQRFVVVILRGALDGMSAVVPYGDPNLVQWRGSLIPSGPGAAGGLLDLGGFFGLHPSMGSLHAMYQSGEFLPVHAVAGPYRSRSHFEAQDYMESGTDHVMTSGWLNRVVSVLPPTAAGRSSAGPAISMEITTPLILRGPATIGSWSQAEAGTPDQDLYARLSALSATDPTIGPIVAEGLRARAFEVATLKSDGNGDAVSMPGDKKSAFVTLCRGAGTMLGAADGPRIAALEIGGWDTHTQQLGRLLAPLSDLDRGLLALKTALGPAWSRTVVLTMTEFGRTVRVNGTGGTDHGTGSVAFVAGGAVHGGRVAANWPGLSQRNLFENRDLQPTIELRSVAKGILATQFGLSDQALSFVFPDSAASAPMSGIFRT
jgi:uncharacterized protein (DUF1501 family)